jgi:hypothetical protein
MRSSIFVVLAGCNGILGIGAPHVETDTVVDSRRDAPDDARADAHADAMRDAPADGPEPGLIADFAADLGVHTNGGLVTAWDDQSGHGSNASTLTALGPLLTTTMVNASTRSVLRFDGNVELLAAPHVPAAGTLVIVLSNADHGAADRRVLGWDDSTVGNHGIELIPDYHGTNLALFVARDNGAVGDVSGGIGITVMEIDVASWGSAGTTFDRHLADGQTFMFSSAAISAVSDGGLSLHIGGPGDTSSGVQLFVGDLAALRVYDHQLSGAERAAVMSLFVSRWL